MREKIAKIVRFCGNEPNIAACEIIMLLEKEIEQVENPYPDLDYLHYWEDCRKAILSLLGGEND